MSDSPGNSGFAVHFGKVLGLLLLVWAAVSLFGHFQARAAVRDATAELTAHFDGTAGKHEECRIGQGLRVLLEDGAGLEEARALAAESDLLAVDPEGEFAVYVHDRGDGDSCFGAVGLVPASDGGTTWSVGHAGYPSFVRLETVAVEDRAVVVGFRASDDPAKEALLRDRGLEPGEQRTRTVPFEALEAWRVSPDVLLPETEPDDSSAAR